MSIGTKVRNFMMVRKADLEKEPFVKEWLLENKERNAFDEGVLGYPLLKVLAAHTNGTTHAVMPIHPVAMLESVGTNHESSTQQVTDAMLELVKAAAVLASDGGAKELIFFASDKVTAAGAKRIGFERVKCEVYRIKLP